MKFSIAVTVEDEKLCTRAYELPGRLDVLVTEPEDVLYRIGKELDHLGDEIMEQSTEPAKYPDLRDRLVMIIKSAPWFGREDDCEGCGARPGEEHCIDCLNDLAGTWKGPT